ncbi:hypothetical protein HOK51_05110 [Candidatus Woesearchaeota archaeon]|jgi:hypothetical protein|nr:hypothetical protein [Candidatus Woesearchaeota archaeon]MBT6519206.1 hypothetical protein [Candidatus Woesearchaeota archaeon]MBT7367782.1 hypothetical protein [Candidatus Woesearchaeota archaeon]
MNQAKKTQQYQTYAKGLETDESMVDLLEYISKPKFKCFSQEYLEDYFTQRGMAYSDEEDIDLLVDTIKKELTARNKLDDQNTKLPPQNSEFSNLLNYLKKFDTSNLTNLNSVKESLEQVMTSFYSAVEKDDVKERIIAGNLNGLRDGDFYYTFKKNILSFGIRNHNGKYPDEYNDIPCQFYVKLKKRKNKFKINISFLCSNNDNGTSMFWIRYKSLDAFIDDAKERLRFNNASSYCVKYIKKIIQFPKIILEAKQKEQEELSKLVSELISETKSTMAEYKSKVKGI